MIDFIEEQHIYLKDGIITPSVSEILHFIFPDKYKNISAKILNKKAEYGSKVHEAVEILEKTGIQFPKGYRYEDVEFTYNISPILLWCFISHFCRSSPVYCGLHYPR